MDNSHSQSTSNAYAKGVGSFMEFLRISNNGQNNTYVLC